MRLPPVVEEAAELAPLPPAILAALQAAQFARTGPIATLSDAVVRTFTELLRCVAVRDPGGHFRITVKTLMRYRGKSRNTISRHLAVLVGAGLLRRWQTLRGSRRHGFRAALMRLTPLAVGLLFPHLQRAPFVRRDSKQTSSGKRWERPFRAPKAFKQAFAPVVDKLKPGQLGWLFRECSARGKRLEHVLHGAVDAALAAADTAAFIYDRLTGHQWRAHAATPAGTPAAVRAHNTAAETARWHEAYRITAATDEVVKAGARRFLAEIAQRRTARAQ